AYNPRRGRHAGRSVLTPRGGVMSAEPVLTIHTDGAARGNPGPAAFAYVISRNGEPPIEEAGCLGRTTNNQAEYTALVRALEHALRLGTQHRLVVHSDSELMVKQMKGEYRVKDPGLKPLYEKAVQLSGRFDHKPRFVHVRREQNSRADALCNEALDGVRLPGGPAPPPPPATPQPSLRDDAVAARRQAATEWARGNPAQPSAETVWQRLWQLLQNHGVVP